MTASHSLVERLRDLRLGLGTAAVEDGRWTERAEATIGEAADTLAAAEERRKDEHATAQAMHGAWRLAEARITALEDALRPLVEHFTDDGLDGAPHMRKVWRHEHEAARALLTEKVAE